MNLSEAAKRALINVGTNRQGALLKGATSPEAAELSAAGLVGSDHGLTRKGTIERMKAVRAAEDAAFG